MGQCRLHPPPATSDNRVPHWCEPSLHFPSLVPSRLKANRYGTKRLQVSSRWVRRGAGCAGHADRRHTGWMDRQPDGRTGGAGGLFLEVEWILARRHAWAVSQRSSRNFHPPLPLQQPNDSNRLHTPLLSVSESNCGAEAACAVKSEQSPDPTYHTVHGPKEKKKKKLRFTPRCEVSRQHILKKILGRSAKRRRSGPR